MAAIPGLDTFNPVFNQQQVEGGGINDVNIDDFLKIMITELQNQDPLNPLENDELIAQISQIRSVGATEKLTETLDSVLLGQNISSATNLIGAEIDAISDDNQKVTGLVERVSVAGGKPKLHLDLNPHVDVSNDETGDIEAGKYEYRVVWEEDGTLFGVDPLASTGKEYFEVKEDGAADPAQQPADQHGREAGLPPRSGGKRLPAGGRNARRQEARSFLDVVATEDLGDRVLERRRRS